MTDFPTPNITPLFINTYSKYFCGGTIGKIALLGAVMPTSVSWNLANEAVYFPFSLPFKYHIRRLFWGNGSAAGSNSSIGIYGVDGGGIYTSGSVAGSGNSQLQYVTASPDIVLDPGLYFLGFSHSSTSANRIMAGNITTNPMRRVGCYKETSALPLPASATFAGTPTSSKYILAGFTRTASGF